jgi:integrase
MNLRVVHGKGGKERMVPLHPDVLGALRALPMATRGIIFRRCDGSPYTPDHLSHLLCTFLHTTPNTTAVYTRADPERAWPALVALEAPGHRPWRSREGAA